MKDKALQFNNLFAGYHGSPVIRDLSLCVEQGEMIGLLGPNGAGKTTLFRCITGLCTPLSGTVSIFGNNTRRLTASKRARLVAVVPQELEISVPFTIQEIVTIGRTASLSRWTPPSNHDRNIIERAMVYTDVADMKHRPFTELSGGEKQRAIVAMAIAQEPSMILMDEATSCLDINHRLEIMQIIERLNIEQDVTVLMISHDINTTAEFCRRLLIMDHGRIVADGAPSKVLTEETLRHVYHCDVHIQKNSMNGSVTVLPAPRLTHGKSGQGIRVHIISGGGCGEEIMRRLSLCGYTLTCGVLNNGDSDTETARALGIETALEKPFSPVSQPALETAGKMTRETDAIVICGVPFGPGNVVNLDLAQQALDAGKPVLIMEGIADRDYTPDRIATKRVQDLMNRGAKSWQDLTDLLNMIPHTSIPQKN